MHFMLITSKMELKIDENQQKILIEVPENMENAWNLPLHIERERKRIIAVSLEGSISLSTCMKLLITKEIYRGKTLELFIL